MRSLLLLSLLFCAISQRHSRLSKLFPIDGISSLWQFVLVWRMNASPLSRHKAHTQNKATTHTCIRLTIKFEWAECRTEDRTHSSNAQAHCSVDGICRSDSEPKLSKLVSMLHRSASLCLHKSVIFYSTLPTNCHLWPLDVVGVVVADVIIRHIYSLTHSLTEWQWI